MSSTLAPSFCRWETQVSNRFKTQWYRIRILISRLQALLTIICSLSLTTQTVLHPDQVMTEDSPPKKRAITSQNTIHDPCLPSILARRLKKLWAAHCLCVARSLASTESIWEYRSPELMALKFFHYSTPKQILLDHYSAKSSPCFFWKYNKLNQCQI